MTGRDFGGLSQAQQDTLGLIAIGLDSGHSPRTLDVLERQGLIISYVQQIRVPPLGMMTVKRWEVSLPVHIAWCEWCSRQEDDEQVG